MRSKNPIPKPLALLVLLFSTVFSVRAGSPQIQNFNTQNPFTFEENKGQLADEDGRQLPDILYFGRDNGLNVYCFKEKIAFVFTKTDIYKKTNAPHDSIQQHLLHGKIKDYSADSSVVTASRMEMQFIGANPNPTVISEEPQEAYSNYYLAHCTTGITAHTFNKLTYKNIYPSIDLVLSTNGKGMEYSFVVYPGGDVNNIRMRWNGADSMQYQAEQGSIHYANSLGSLTESGLSAAVAGGLKVNSAYMVQGNEVSFSVSDYDKGQVLVIDPYIVWKRFEIVKSDISDIDLDSYKNFLITGTTANKTGIATSGAFQTVLRGSQDAYIEKRSYTNALLWRTYFGGNKADYSDALATDGANIFITGFTASDSGIATSGAFQTKMPVQSQYSSGAFFIAKFSSSGLLKWGTYVVRNQEYWIDGFGSDSSGNVVLIGGTEIDQDTTMSTSGAFQRKDAGTYDMFIVKFSPSGQRLWGTYFGGPAHDADWWGSGTTDRAGNIYLTGNTKSGYFGTASTYMPVPDWGTKGYPSFPYGDAFLTKFSPSGARMWSTYFGGGNNGAGTNIAVDNAGNVFLTGFTRSTKEVASAGAFQSAYGGLDFDPAYASLPNDSFYWAYGDAFLAKFSSAGKLDWGTYYGGAGNDQGYTLAPDNSGGVYMGGRTTSKTGFATANALQTDLVAKYGCFLAHFSSSCKRTWGTYFEPAYSLHADSDNLFVVGFANPPDTFHSGYYYAKISFKSSGQDVGIGSIFGPVASGCPGLSDVKVHLNNYGISELDSVRIGWSVNGKAQSVYHWTGKIKKDSGASVTLGSYTFPIGYSTIKAWTIKPNGVIDSVHVNDTATVVFSMTAPPAADAGKDTIICKGAYVKIGSAAVSGMTYSWTSRPAGFTSTSSNPYAAPAITTTYYLTVTNSSYCSSVDSVTVNLPLSNVPLYGKSVDVCVNAVNTISLPKDTSHYSYSWRSKKATVMLDTNKDTVRISWDKTGIDTAWVIVSNTAGCKDSAKFIITVHAIPSAHWKVSHTGKNYHFTADNASLKNYTWNFGDGSAGDTGKSVTHVFPKNKNYKVSLLVADQYGCTTNFDSTILIAASGLAEAAEDIPAAISIYPNPFSSITTLAYTLDKPSEVSIEVLDMQGRKVATLAAGDQMPGSHSCEFDAGKYNCSAGIYLVKVLIADQVAVRRIVRIN
jgi:hypothetical protein